MERLETEETGRRPRGRLVLVVMALAGLVFVGSAAIKPSQAVPSDPVAAAVEPMAAVVHDTPAEAAPGEIAAAAVEGAGDAAQEATPIDWAMLGSAATFLLSGVGALAGLVFGWRNDRRGERLATLRARELELEIARLRGMGAA
jgi:hypothetical protein